MRPPLGRGFGRVPGRVPWDAWEQQLRLFPFVAVTGSERAGLGLHILHFSVPVIETVSTSLSVCLVPGFDDILNAGHSRRVFTSSLMGLG